MKQAFRIGFADIFRLRIVWPMIIIGAGSFAAAGRWDLASGVLIGGLLFTLNSFFIYETGKSLLAGDNRRRTGLIAAFAPLWRLMFLGTAFAGVSAVGHSTLFAAMGGMLLGQVAIHLGYLRHKEVADCPET